MGFIYTTAIKKIRKMKARIKIVPGGTSAGKTYAIIPILIDKAIKQPGISISVVSESVPHLKRGAIKDFIDIMRTTGRYKDTSWNITDKIYRFQNGSYIEFFSVDSPGKLRGARRNVLYVNECNNITEEAYTQLSMRTDMDIYLDYNPSHKFWIDDVKKSNESETLILTYKDNEGLAQTIVDFLEGKRELAKTSKYWANYCTVYLDGQEGELDGTVFNNYTIIDKLPEGVRLIGCGLDFGYTNDPTSLVAIYKWNDKYILSELLYETGMLNSTIANYIKNNVDINRYPIIADSAEPKSIAEIRSRGINIKGVKKGKGSIDYGIGLMQEHELVILSSATNIINEFKKYTWAKDRDGNATNKPIDNYNHSIDAIRYLFMELISKTKAPFGYDII